MSDPQTLIACPGCGQRYFVWALQIQEREEMACSRCNSTFLLEIDGKDIKPVLLHGPTGSPLGPAETPTRH